MRRLYIDLRMGISGDMFPAACYQFINKDAKSILESSLKKACKELGIDFKIDRVTDEPGFGSSLSWLGGDRISVKDPKEAIGTIRNLGESAGLSEFSRILVDRIMNDIIEAEADAHRISLDKVHLHEIGRKGALMNIVASGLCFDLLERRRLIASYISIGDGMVETAHGILKIPVPASAHLLRNMRFRFGPFEGEMATPTGIAIARNIIEEQVDYLPEASRRSVGYGEKTFNGRKGFVRLFESGTTSQGD